MKTAEQKLLDAVYAPTPVIYKEDISIDGKLYNEVTIDPEDEVLAIKQVMEEGASQEVFFTIGQLEEILAAAKKHIA